MHNQCNGTPWPWFILFKSGSKCTNPYPLQQHRHHHSPHHLNPSLSTLHPHLIDTVMLQQFSEELATYFLFLPLSCAPAASLSGGDRCGWLNLAWFYLQTCSGLLEPALLEEVLYYKSSLKSSELLCVMFLCSMLTLHSSQKQ